MIPLRPISTLFPYTTLFRSSSLIVDAVDSCFRVGPEEATAVVNEVKCTVGALTQVDWTREHVEPHFDRGDRKSTRLNSSHVAISYAVFCLKKKKKCTRAHCD